MTKLTKFEKVALKEMTGLGFTTTFDAKQYEAMHRWELQDVVTEVQHKDLEKYTKVDYVPKQKENCRYFVLNGC